jgi:hypothetical protein
MPAPIRSMRSPPPLVELLEPPRDRGEGVRLELAEGERLHLGHEFVHADPLRKRGVDVHRLAGDAAPFLLILDEVERAHVVQAIGELHQQHPDVPGHGEQELAQVLRGALILALRLDLGKLRNAVDETGDVLAEQPLHFFGRGDRILDRVVKDRGDDRLVVQPQIGEDARNFDRVAVIRIARSSLLAAMRLHREDVGAVDHRLVRVGIVSPYLLEQFILPQHRTNMGCGAAALQHEKPLLCARVALFELPAAERLAAR